MAEDEVVADEFMEENDDGYQSRSSSQNNQNESNINLYQSEENWMQEFNVDELTVLDPDDPLMKRFQNAYKEHLLRLHEKFTLEIKDLKVEIKENEKILEDEGINLYNEQQEVAQQEILLEKYKDELAKIANARDNTTQNITLLEEEQKRGAESLSTMQSKEKELHRTIKSLDELILLYKKWKDDSEGNLKIAERISEKDASVQQELLQKKRQRDYLLYRLDNEIWKLESEIEEFEEQLKIKKEEKNVLDKAIVDANTDYECLQKEQKTLANACKSLLNLVDQREKVCQAVREKRREMEEKLQNIEGQITKSNKDAAKEMENHEYLTAQYSRINEELEVAKKQLESDKDKCLHLESDLARLSKLTEQKEKELGIVQAERESLINEEKSLDKELFELKNRIHEIEQTILATLDDKILQDKEMQNINKQIRELKESNSKKEIRLTKLRNTHGKVLYKIEELRSCFQNKEFDLNVIKKENIELNTEIERMKKEMSQSQALLQQKTNRKCMLDRKIEEIKAARGEQTNPLDAQITDLQNKIDEADKQIEKLQKLGLRQQSTLLALYEQRDFKLQEASILNKDILLLEQKHRNIQIKLEEAQKEEADIDKTIRGLQQQLSQHNHRLASLKDSKNEEEKKCLKTRDELLQSLKDSEMSLVKLQNEVKKYSEKRDALKDELKQIKLELVSWEKKVEMAKETRKAYKEEMNSGGDIAMMKSEIHTLELRLSKLQKTQERLAREMELTVSQRESIIDKAFTKEKRDPKILHNEEITLRKRTDYKKTKLRATKCEIKRIDAQIQESKSKQTNCLEYLDELQKSLRQKEDIIADFDKQIIEAELKGNHIQEILSRKKRKLKMLRDLKDGKYKPIYKDETTLSNEWQKQIKLNNNLKEIMLKTQQDFPLLNIEIQQILLNLEISENK